MNPKVAAETLYKNAVAANVRFPKTWDEVKATRDVGTRLLALPKTEEGAFDLEAGLKELIEKYGVEGGASEASTKASEKAEGVEEEAGKGKGSKKKRKTADDDDDEDGEEKKKKKSTCVIEGNAPLNELLLEISKIYFQRDEKMKGGVYSKAAMAIRQAEELIDNKKVAMKLKGVGKGVGAIVEEFQATGQCKKLEEMRGGEQ